MDNQIEEQLQQGFATAFIDTNVASNLAYKPEFVSNNYKEGRKVISSIEDELLRCQEFSISVAFITMSGITPILQTLKELENRNVSGCILTTDYLNFSEPKALKKLSELRNITLKMYTTNNAQEGFHTKGYIFKRDEIYRIIVGSSNMTLSALTTNKEWNTKIVSTTQGEYTQDIISEFNQLWNSESTQSYEEFIEEYTAKYNAIKKQRTIAKAAEIPSIEQYRLQPNAMQTAFIVNLQKIHEAGEKRALLISATGTGKTYASAFALREENPKKALFLVHREQIAKQAIASYKKVFGNIKTFGLLSGNSKDYEVDYLFSTMQMMAKPETLECFGKNEFEFIIIDEAHRVGAASYQNIMEYFEPEFWLGMTASPERTDNYDVYQAFNHNIAYEIRLQQALEENLLCPFHYFGITELNIDGEAVDEKTGLLNFNKLTSDTRVNYVIEQMEYYGYSGERVKGLVFCSSKKEASTLSDKFNNHGYQTIALTGEDSQEKRELAIERLVSDDIENKLDYIFTVDIFNEGVDIPEINQVIMLRPTESPVVFVQQLGRGLRKANGKEYVVILDFIGNYKNNFMIPIALSGDRSYNKDNIRRYVLEGERIIPGSSTIHFDEISKKRIFAAIDTANFSDIKLIKENYKNLKNKLGHIPKLQDFDKYGEMDVLRIFDNSSLGSYYKFLVKYEKDYAIRLSDAEEKAIEFVSKKLASGKRIHELELLKRTLMHHHGLIGMLKKSLSSEYGISLQDKSVENVVNVMTNEFPVGTGKQTYSECVFIQKDNQTGDFRISDSFEKMLENPAFYEILKELVAFGIERYKVNYSNRYQDTNFVLYQKYTYEDVCRLLEWKNNEVPLNIGGYKYDKQTQTFPVFINYDKREDIQDTIKYEDHFVSTNKLIAISKQSRTKESEDVQNFLYAEQREIKVELFVRKNKDDKISKEFYYLGRMKATGQVKEFIMVNTEKTAVEIEWLLDTPVREDIYEYIVNG
ncbi:DEAD/DEAH box helicase [Anaerosporobacter sp.]|uniref:DEAD/DEAH box helicase n=1 Tax=Anaerosporobacter sp. TaxID=1872529 RepID=UPI00286F1212|nr:DEAD/DEAH box helicase [Anaerosporobacter sp.]